MADRAYESVHIRPATIGTPCCGGAHVLTRGAASCRCGAVAIADVAVLETQPPPSRPFVAPTEPTRTHLAQLGRSCGYEGT